MEVAALGATTEVFGAVHAAADPLASSLHTATAMLAQAEEEVVGLGGRLLGYEFTWTLLLTIITFVINTVFEEVVHLAKHRIPRAYLPVLEKILGELTTLGFVSLVFQQAQETGGLASFLDAASERFLGDSGVIMDIFNSIAPAIFPLTIAFAATCTAILFSIASRFNGYSGFSSSELLRTKLAEDKVRAECEVRIGCGGGKPSVACVAAVQRSATRGGMLLTNMVMSSPDDAARNPLRLARANLSQSAADQQAEFLRFRARFVEQAGIQDDFKFAMYLTECAVENLEALVSVDAGKLARVWLPIICVEAGLIAAAGGGGDIYLGGVGQGETLLPLVVALSQLPIAVWGAWNYARLHNIKSMLCPQLASSRDKSPAPSYRDDFERPKIYKLLPPRYALFGGAATRSTRDPYLTWWGRAYEWSAVIEQLYVASHPRERTAAVFRHDMLYGKLGQAGPEFYMDSMKLVLYAATVSFAFVASGGLDDLARGAAEALFGGPCAVVDAAQRALTLAALTPSLGVLALTPSTFLAYNWGTSVEGLRRDALVDKLEAEQRIERFLVTLASLARLCEWVELALEAGERDGTLGPRRTEAQVEAEWQVLLASTSPWTLLDVRALFESQDEDDSGTLDIDEVEAIVRLLGYTPSARAIAALFAHMDADRTEAVRFREFTTVLVRPSAEEAGVGSSTTLGIRFDAGALARLFRFFDEDGSGGVDEAEMLDKLGELGFERRGALQLFGEMRGKAETVISRQVFDAFLVDKGVAVAL